MNIIIIVSSLSYGGAEKQAIIDSNILSKDHNVWLISFRDGPQKELVNKEVNYIEFRKSGYLTTAKRLTTFCKENKIDAVHTSLFAPSIITAISSITSGVKVIWHFHSHEYDARWFSKIAFIICARFKSVAKIYFVNNELKDYLGKRFFLPKKKLGILYNTSSFQQGMQKKQKLNEKIIIGYVGRLVDLKRVSYLIETAEYLLKEKIDNFEFWILGDGEDRDKLEEYATLKNLSNYVKFLGFKKDTDKYYSQFDLFILPSREECLSIALIDAVTMGLPSIAFDVGGNNEIIENNTNGYIVNSKNELFEKTKLLVNDLLLRKKLSKNALKFSKEKFSQITRKEALVQISYNAIKN